VAKPRKDERITNGNLYVDVTVYTQMKEDSQWGIFDFEAAAFDPKTKRLGDSTDFDSEAQRGYEINVEMCRFEVKGTSYITRQSKFEMSYISPIDSSPKQ